MHEPTELPEPFRSLLYDLEKPLPADFPKEMQRSSFDEMFEGMPEDLRPNLPKPLLDELTKSIFDESMKATIEDSKDILPDEYLQTLLDEFNRTLPDDTPRPPRDQAIQHLRYTLIKQQIDGNQNLFDDCRQILLDQYRKLEYDEYRQFIRDGHHKSLANGFPQRVLEMWRRLYPGIRDKFSTLKPEVDEMCDVAEQVQAVIQLLCERDERFSFIHSALEEFVNGHDGLQDCQESVDRIDSTDPNELEDFVAMDKLSEILTWPISRRKRDPADMMNLKGALHEIIDSTIYELLDVFRDIKIEQPSIGTSLMTHFDLLYDLYRKSELSTPQPAIQVTPKPREDSANETSYQYPSRLNSAIGEVRTIKILPSTRKERIECHLVVRNLYHDDIPEALSYVWGKDMSTEKILVDHKPFTVTNNLLKILRDLRRLDITREIWIDAICINQSDFNEKTDQVQLMKEIYSRAKNTVIWLSGAHTESKQIEVSVKNQGEYPVENQRADQSFNMEGLYAPIPVGLGGVDIDQYDLAAILKESLKYSMDAPWCEKQMFLYIILLRCAALVLLYSWWERVWTIQEAACPPNAPIFFFHGHCFSFDDFTAAMNIASKLSSGSEHITKQIKNRHDIMGSEAWQAVYKIVSSQIGLLSRVPLLLLYRRGLEVERHSVVKTFMVLLAMAETYRATDPRDKIFALQSLLPKCMGLLIKVDYKEHCETVFRRATARYYNASPNFYLMNDCKFWFESLLSAEDPAGPSWVLDFTYTDAGFRGNKSIRETKHKVTLDGFISENNLSHLKLEDGADNMCLCTPTTLFCTGHYIDQVRWVGLMPRLSDAATLTAFTVLTSLTLEVFNTRESLLGIPATTEFGDDVNTEFLSITHFLLMQNNEPLDLENLDELANIRNQELVGKPVFITEKGLVGIATALIKPGDSLSWIHGSPIYLILREVENRDNSSDDVRQDCIVARAAVNDKLIHGKKNMKDLIYSTPSLPFQIV